MIKVIASDLDGTLLGDNHLIASRTLETVRRAIDAGFRFMITTGRNLNSALQALNGEELHCDYLVGSGSEVYNPQREVVSRIEVGMDLCEEIYKTLKEYPVRPIFISDRADYMIGTKEEVEEGLLLNIQLFFLNMPLEEILKTDRYWMMREKTRQVDSIENLRNLGVPIYKVFLATRQIECLPEIKEKLERNGKLAVSSSFIDNLEITDIRAQKGPVLKEYIESLGYTMDEVMVFGDSLNDYSMISMDFGVTIAMENAEPEVKAAAKYITKTNEEYGVACVIDELLRQRAEEREGY